LKLYRKNGSCQAYSESDAEAAAASSSSSSISESGKIFGLEGLPALAGVVVFHPLSIVMKVVIPIVGDVEITLSDTNAKKTNAGIEGGEIAGGSGIAAAEEPGENLAGVQASPEDLIKTGTCFMGQSLMTQEDLDALVLEGCFSFGDCRLPGKEMTPKPRSNESDVVQDFFTAGLRLPILTRFADILAAYNVQIHQLTPNSISQILKFLWACRTFAGTKEVDTFVCHFEIHWDKKTLVDDDDDKEAQHGCCTFQTHRINKNQPLVELAPAYQGSPFCGIAASIS
jgi:hypothetical protein